MHDPDKDGTRASAWRCAPCKHQISSQMPACVRCLHAGLNWPFTFGTAQKKCTAKVDVMRGHAKRVWQARYLIQSMTKYHRLTSGVCWPGAGLPGRPSNMCIASCCTTWSHCLMIQAPQELSAASFQGLGSICNVNTGTVRGRPFLTGLIITVLQQPAA